MRHTGLVLSLMTGISPVATAQRGSVAGRVQSATDSSALEGAVLVLNADAVTITDSSGRFRFDGVPGGTSVLAVRRIGYESLEIAVWVDSDRDLTIDMSPAVFRLDDIDVIADRRDATTRRLEREGFFERQRAGFGHFFDRERLAAMNVVYTRDLLRMLPARYRDPCAIFVDGIAVDADSYDGRLGTLDMLLKASQIEAMEVYAIGAEMPARFNVTRDRDCGGGAIVIWTR